MTENNELPLWDLESLYGDFGSKAYQQDCNRLSRGLVQLQKRLEDLETGAPWNGPELEDFLTQYFLLGDLAETLSSFAYMCYSVKTQDPGILREMNRIEQINLGLHNLSVTFRESRNLLANPIKELLRKNSWKDLRLFFEEESTLQKRQMGSAEESLAQDLARVGGDAWGRLQASLSSTLSVVWDESSGERKTVTQLRLLSSDPARGIRKKAYDLELQAWKSVAVPLAAALNGVKGTSVILNKRRGWKNPLQKSLFQNRINEQSLTALRESMEESLPVFQGYMKSKAQALGQEALSFYDLFAPLDLAESRWSYPQARDFIVENFNRFDPEFGAFAQKAFEKGWIHARPQEGKVGGAYCIALPQFGETRILCNFDQSFKSVKTMAHELGHAYHDFLITGKTRPHRNYPMTLAETASIFAETIIFEKALSAAGPEEALGLLESQLSDSTQVIVDILSRYYFESQVMELRPRGELSPGELNELMLDAQTRCYGDALKKDERHPYMWAVKGHYYSPDLAYYNYPYAFGLLFSLGLYSKYKVEGESFVTEYRSLLSRTGLESAKSLAQSLGMDLESKNFWKQGLKLIENQVMEFQKNLQ